MHRNLAYGGGQQLETAANTAYYLMMKGALGCRHEMSLC